MYVLVCAYNYFLTACTTPGNIETFPRGLFICRDFGTINWWRYVALCSLVGRACKLTGKGITMDGISRPLLSVHNAVRAYP